MKKNYIKIQFTTEEEEKLIHLVRDEPCLYDFKNELHKNHPHRLKVWYSIGQKLKKSPYECQKKWTIIRDYYVRNRGKSSSIANATEFVRKRLDSLQFLDDSNSSKRSRSAISSIKFEMNDTEPNETETDLEVGRNSTFPDSDNDIDLVRPQSTDSQISQSADPLQSIHSLPSTSSRSRYRKQNAETSCKRIRSIDESLEDFPTGNTELEFFCLSLRLTLERLPLAAQVEMKMAINNLVCKKELEIIKQIDETETGATSILTSDERTRRDDRLSHRASRRMTTRSSK